MYINLLVNAHSDQNIAKVCYVNMTYTLTDMDLAVDVRTALALPTY